jgi:hypothetical protein
MKIKLKTSLNARGSNDIFASDNYENTRVNVLWEECEEELVLPL